MQNAKYNALMFTKSLLQKDGGQRIDNSHNHEPPNKLQQKEIPAQSSIIDYLLLLQAKGELFVQRTNNTGVYDPSNKTYRQLPKGAHRGFPDIFILKDGRCIFLEVKSSTGSLSQYQKEMEQQVLRNGGEFYLVRTVDYVEKIL